MKLQWKSLDYGATAYLPESHPLNLFVEMGIYGKPKKNLFKGMYSLNDARNYEAADNLHWFAEVRMKGIMRLGQFDTYDEAKSAVESKAQELFGHLDTL
jgi:hypothetical protein